ncbi:MAG: TolC family protein [Bacteroidia bacterium]
MKKLVIFIFSILILTLQSSAQSGKRWTLKECISYAIENNFQIAQSDLQVEQSRINTLQSKASVIPTLSGGANHTYNFGRRIDPFTNQFATNRVLSQNFSLSSGVNLFSGLSNTQTIFANQLAEIAAKYQNDQLKNDVSLQITNAFLQIILSDELLSISESQLKTTQIQRDQGKLLYEAGRTAKGDFLQTEAQLANEELNVVTSKNRVDLAKLTLAQLIGLEDASDFDVERPDFSSIKMELPPYNERELITVAFTNQPGVIGAEYQVRSAEKNIKAARGAYYPSLSAFGGIGTGYSQLARSIIGSSTQTQNLGTFMGQPIDIDVQVPITELTPFSDQLTQNFNRTVGLSLNVPIFNNLRSRNQVSLQKISLENARLQENITKNQLRRDIQTAFFDARSAFERFKATQKSVVALEESFGYMQERYNVGMLNTLEYNTSKNQLIAAQSNLAQARYEFILRIKVLDFYQGNTIEL